MHRCKNSRPILALRPPYFHPILETLNTSSRSRPVLGLTERLVIGMGLTLPAMYLKYRLLYMMLDWYFCLQNGQ